MLKRDTGVRVDIMYTGGVIVRYRGQVEGQVEALNSRHFKFSFQIFIFDFVFETISNFHFKFSIFIFRLELFCFSPWNFFVSTSLFIFDFSSGLTRSATPGDLQRESDGAAWPTSIHRSKGKQVDSSQGQVVESLAYALWI